MVKQALKGFESHFGINGKRQIGLFWLFLCLFCAYSAFVAYAQCICRSIEGGFNTLFFAVLALLLGVIAVWCFAAIKTKEATERNSLHGLFFATFIAVLTFSVFYYWQRGFYPGSFSPDSIVQYEQVQNGKYNDWHPFLHTLLFFGVPNIFSDSPALTVTLQIVWFSLALGYLFYVLYTEGCGIIACALCWLYLAANPNTLLIMLYPWKDSAFSILSTVVFSFLIRIFKSRGEWLLRVRNLMAFSAFSFLALSVRHNAVMLIAPIFAILFFAFKKLRKEVLISAVSLVLLTFLVKVPVFSAFGVESPNHRVAEVVGLPMTLLADIYMEDRRALPDDARAFLDSLATQENWKKYHTHGSFNSFKWSDEEISFKIDEQGTIRILDYAYRSANASPKVAKRSLFDLTKMVWGAGVGGGWQIGYGITRNDFGIAAQYTKDEIKPFTEYRNAINGGVFGYLFNYTGVIILLILAISISRIGKNGAYGLFAAIPLVIYDFGTMLLLTGHDFRFFHLNFMLVIPILYVAFACKSD